MKSHAEFGKVSPKLKVACASVSIANNRIVLGFADQPRFDQSPNGHAKRTSHTMRGSG
jgi:hypothetical protein